MITITEKEWNKISDSAKGKWTREIKENGWQSDLPEEFIGKKTVLSGCISSEIGSLLTEGAHFQIINSRISLSNNEKSKYFREKILAELEKVTLKELLIKYWGLEDEDCLENHINAFLKLINLGIIQDELTAKSIVRYDRIFNRYEYVNSYYELSSEMVADDCLWENIDKDSDKFYNFILNENDERILKEKLKEQGWYVLESVALGLDVNDNQEI